MPRVHSSFTALLCALVFSCSVSVAAQNATSETNRTERVAQSAPKEEWPDSPGAIWAKSQNPVPQTDQDANPQVESAQSASASSNKDKDKDSDPNGPKLQRPVGTAAAEAPKVSGITAAEPAGAAIAPAKQHRVRTIVIKVGAIIGAGAAIGTVVALSAATPSRPPGAH